MPMPIDPNEEKEYVIICRLDIDDWNNLNDHHKRNGGKCGKKRRLKIASGKCGKERK
jgi:hypothetical protein